MAQLDGTFDATQHDPTPRFQVLPRDKYHVEIVRSDMKATNDGNGAYLELEMEILDGQYAGRKVFDRLNLVNQNEMTVEIAQRTLSQICHAIGVLAVSDSEQLHRKAMIADVRVRPARTDEKTGKSYDESNEIRGYSSIHGDKPATHTTTQNMRTTQNTHTTQSAPTANAATVPPWRRAKG
jgi:Protein of unknown function (DUF669)